MIRKKIKIFTLFCSIGACNLLLANDAQIGHMGRLVALDGSPLTGTADILFDIHYSGDINPSGRLCYLELPGVPLTNGVYNVNLDFSVGPGSCNLNEVFKNTPVGQTVLIRVHETSRGLSFDWQNILNVPLSLRSEFAGLAEDIPDAIVTAEKIDQMGASANQVLTWTGSEWEPRAIPEGNPGTVTSVVAGDALTTGGTAADPVLNVNVDDSTIEISGNNLQLKDGGVSNSKLDDNAVTPAKMALNPNEFGQLAPILSLIFNPAGALNSTILGIGVLTDNNYIEIQGNELTLSDSSVIPGTGYTSFTVDSKGRITAAGQITNLQIPYVESLLTACPVGETLISAGGTMVCQAPSTTATPVGSADGDLEGTYPNPTIKNGVVTYAKTNFSDGDIPQAKINGLTATLATQSTGIANNASAIAANSSDIATAQSDIANLVTDVTTDLAGKEPTITAGTTAQYWRGDKTWQALNTTNVPEGINLYFLESRVRDTILDGYSIGANVAIDDEDTLIEAIAKLEAQVQATIAGASSGTVTSITAGAGLSGGTITGSGTIALPSVGTAGTYGSATQVPVLTTDAYGRVTGVTNTTISGVAPAGAAGGDLSGTYPNPTIRALSIDNSHISATANIAQSKIDGLTTALAGKEPTITAGTSTQYLAGDKTWQTLNTTAVPEGSRLYFTQDRVRTTPLTGLVTTPGVVAATDSLIVALGKMIGNFGLINGSQWSTSGSNVSYTGGNVGIGTTAPTTKLDVNGQVRIRGGSPGAGKVLTSDATGLATWETISTSSGTVTSITAGTGLTGGTITSTGTIAVNTGTSANQIPMLDAGAKLPISTIPAITSAMITPGTIVNADVSASAAIAQSKIANLTTDLAGKANTATTITAGTGLTGGGNLSANRTIAVDVGTTAGKIPVLDAGAKLPASTIPTITSAMITPGTIVNADVSASAAIARSKLASGVANRLVVNNASGVLTDAPAITAARALISDANGIPSASTVTSTQLGYLSGVTSAIQTQLNTRFANGGNSFGGTATIGTNDAFNLSLETSNVARMTILSTGNVGIGTAAPTQRLHVAGNVIATGFLYSSDERLKENLSEIEDPLHKINLLHGLNFDWIDTKSKDIGFIAQDVQRNFPELVDTDPETGFLSVKYGNIVAITVEAIKDLTEVMLENQRKLAYMQGVPYQMLNLEREIEHLNGLYSLIFDLEKSSLKTNKIVEKNSRSIASLEKENLELKKRVEELESKVEKIDKLEAQLKEVLNRLNQ